jgi:DNA (cytosine-5)-methyltransferase 1
MQTEKDKTPTLMARDYKDPTIVCYPVGINGDKCSTLDGHYYLGCGARGGIEREVVAEKKQSEWVVRRLTPTECARLQGMPDWWCSDIEHRDAPEYKMWGNGMALPNVMYVMEGLAAELRQEKINQILGE